MPGEKVGKTAAEVQAVDGTKVEDETGSGAEMRVCGAVVPGKKEETPPGGIAPVIAESATIWQSEGSPGSGGANGPIVAMGAGIGVRARYMGGEVPFVVWLSGFELMCLDCGLTVTAGFLALIVEEGGEGDGGANLCVVMCGWE